MPPPPSPPAGRDEVLAVLEAVRPEGASGPPPDWLPLLFRGRGVALDLIEASVRAAPSESVPWLAAIVDEDDLCFVRAVGGGYAPMNAALALGSAPVQPGIDALIRAVTRTEQKDDLHLAARDVLSEMGAPAVEPLIAARAAHAPDTDAWYQLSCTLAEMPEPHPRIREIILELLAEDEALGAELCGMSQDPELIPHLRARWDAFVVDESGDDPDANVVGGHLAGALLDLGAPWAEADEIRYAKILGVSGGAPGADEEGHPDADLDDDLDDDEAYERDLVRDDLRDLLDESQRLKRPDGAPLVKDEALADAPIEPLARREKPSRNDPCWCGSGKKYKKCHLDADERG